jgi:hypothetical protein
MKIVFILLFIVPVVITSGTLLQAQSNEQLLCSMCQQPNDPKNNFCTSCGATFVPMTVEVGESEPSGYRQPARLFSIPVAHVLPELQLGITLGNTFGLEVGESFLGTMVLGIGNIAEIELSTAGLITSIAAGNTSLRTTGLKAQLFESDELGLIAGVSLRNSNDWENENRTETVIAHAAPDEYAAGLRGLSYESRITTLSLAIDKQFGGAATLHAGLGYSDIRYRNVYSRFVTGSSFFMPNEERRQQWQVLAGLLVVISPRTRLMAEAQNLPFLAYTVGGGGITARHIYVGAMGFRFSISQSWSLDSGVRYQSNFVGLADTQVRFSLNGVFSLR